MKNKNKCQIFHLYVDVSQLTTIYKNLKTRPSITVKLYFNNRLQNENSVYNKPQSFPALDDKRLTLLLVY